MLKYLVVEFYYAILDKSFGEVVWSQMNQHNIIVELLSQSGRLITLNSGSAKTGIWSALWISTIKAATLLPLASKK